MRVARYKGRHLKPRPNPLAGPAAAGTATAVLLAGSPAHAAVKHRVREGDTLSAIGARYGVSVTKIAKANRIKNPNFIVAGDALRIPGRRGASRGASTYVVRSGDTLSEIAGRFGTTSRAIARRNKIRNVNLIRVGQRLRLVGARRGSATARLQRSSRARVGRLLHREAVAHGLSPSLVKAVAWQESGWKQHVVSSAGAIGVMQVMPGTADYVNTVLGHGNLNVRRTHGNLHLGVAYLRHMLRLFGGNERKALAGYYSGPGNVGRRLNRIQRPYVRSVRALKRRF